MKKPLLPKQIEKKITEAIGLEWQAAATYKYMSNVLKDMGYFGAAGFFQSEGDEELKHYQVWADFVNDMGGCADIPALPKPEANDKSLKDNFVLYYNRELSLLEFYSEWYMECENAAVHDILRDFVRIQRESVGEAGDFLATLDRCGSNESALLLFDHQLKSNG